MAIQEELGSACTAELYPEAEGKQALMKMHVVSTHSGPQ